jgi:hypothetical protein
VQLSTLYHTIAFSGLVWVVWKYLVLKAVDPGLHHGLASPGVDYSDVDYNAIGQFDIFTHRLSSRCVRWHVESIVIPHLASAP